MDSKNPRGCRGGAVSFFLRTVLRVDSVYSLVTSTSFTALIDLSRCRPKYFLRLLTTDLYSGAAIDYRSFNFFCSSGIGAVETPGIIRFSSQLFIRFTAVEVVT